jgi:hypothetical protein
MLLGLLLTSALRLYSESRSSSVIHPPPDSHSCPHSDITRTPVHVRARTLLRLLLTSALGLYSEPRSSSVIHPPPCNPVFTYTDLTRSSVSIHATSSRNSTRTFRSGVRSGIRVSIHLTSPSPHLRAPLGPPSSSTLFLYLQVRARAFGPRPDLRPCPHYNLNPCHPALLGRPLGHLCLAPSYEFEPVPSGPTRTSVIVRVTSAMWI